MPPPSPFLLKPVAEQQRAIELFLKEEGLRIDAYAGTGKTTTLQLLAESTAKRGLYLAFNRSIAQEAQSRFPARVHCATSHSVAFPRRVAGTSATRTGSLRETSRPTPIAEAFRFPPSISFACSLVLERRSYAAVLLDALKAVFFRAARRHPGGTRSLATACSRRSTTGIFSVLPARLSSTFRRSGALCSTGAKGFRSATMGT